MNSVIEQKKQLRSLIKLKKKEMPEIDKEIKSKDVFKEVEQRDEFLKASCVLAFWSLPDEIDTHGFVQKWAGKKQILLPVMVGEGLEVRVFSGFDSLSGDNSFGVMEPITGEVVNPHRVDFAIIPGVAFDNKGNRIGRGKGFYDRLMPQLTNAFKIGVGYDFQLVESIPVADFDIPVDYIICK